MLRQVVCSDCVGAWQMAHEFPAFLIIPARRLNANKRGGFNSASILTRSKHLIGTTAAHIVQFIWWDLKYCQTIFFGWTRADEHPKIPISYNLGKLFQKNFTWKMGIFSEPHNIPNNTYRNPYRRCPGLKWKRC